MSRTALRSCIGQQILQMLILRFSVRGLVPNGHDNLQAAAESVDEVGRQLERRKVAMRISD